MQSEQYWIFIFYIYPASLKTLPFRTSTRHPSTNELKHHLTPCPSPKRRGESLPSPLGEGLGLPARSRFGKGRDGVIKRITLPVHDLLFKSHLCNTPEERGSLSFRSFAKLLFWFSASPRGEGEGCLTLATAPEERGEFIKFTKRRLSLLTNQL